MKLPYRFCCLFGISLTLIACTKPEIPASQEDAAIHSLIEDNKKQALRAQEEYKVFRARGGVQSAY